jgi:hypothetical protein
MVPISILIISASANGQSPPMVNSAQITEVLLGDIVYHTFTQTGGTPPITWNDFMFVEYTPLPCCVTGDGPSIPATFDPDTQLFRWNSIGSPRGVYVWSVRASNVAGSSTGTLTLETYIPEPASLWLAVAALMVVAAVVRRRLSR